MIERDRRRAIARIGQTFVLAHVPFGRDILRRLEGRPIFSCARFPQKFEFEHLTTNVEERRSVPTVVRSSLIRPESARVLTIPYRLFDSLPYAISYRLQAR